MHVLLGAVLVLLREHRGREALEHLCRAQQRRRRRRGDREVAAAREATAAVALARFASQIGGAAQRLGQAVTALGYVGLARGPPLLTPARCGHLRARVARDAEERQQ